jgi:ubiquinone/menaquinone biosynthesis C-methylase UbiE
MTQKLPPRLALRTAAEIYQRTFVPDVATPVSGLLLQAAALRPGERVLDIACGTGVIARLAANQVGPDGCVIGTDVSPDMITVARTMPDPSGMAIDWHVADAASLPFSDGVFDIALCQMGLMFVVDKASAIAEIRRVLSRGGRVALSTPGAIQQPFEILEHALARYIGPDLAGFIRTVFSMHDPRAVADLLHAASFSEVRVSTTTITLHLPPPADFLWQYVASTPLRARVDDAPDGAQDALEREVVDQWQRHTKHGRLVIHQPMVVATARRE